MAMVAANSSAWRRGSRWCLICGREIKAGHEVHWDHIVPKSWGGEETGNLSLTHARCNLGKSNKFEGPMPPCSRCGARHWYEESCDPYVRDLEWDQRARPYDKRWDFGYPELEREPWIEPA